VPRSRRPPQDRPNTGDDLVDRHGPVGGRKFWRPPPVIALQWVIAQVDERFGGADGDVASATVPARPLTRSARAAWLGERVTSQVSVPERSPAAHRRLHHREGDDEIPRPNDTGATNRRRTVLTSVAYSVVSAMPSSLKAS
jgi:hypothetical protein